MKHCNTAEEMEENTTAGFTLVPTRRYRLCMQLLPITFTLMGWDHFTSGHLLQWQTHHLSCHLHTFLTDLTKWISLQQTAAIKVKYRNSQNYKK